MKQEKGFNDRKLMSFNIFNELTPNIFAVSKRRMYFEIFLLV